MNSVDTDFSVVTVARLDTNSEKEVTDALKKFWPRLITRIYAFREMYRMHFSRQNRQQWQHLNPHFTSGFIVCVSLNLRSTYLAVIRRVQTHSMIDRMSWTIAMTSDPYATDPK